MKALKSRVNRCIPVGSRVEACDNSGARLIKIFTILGGAGKGVKRRRSSAGVGDLVMGSVVKGKPDMRKQVVFAVVVRQKKEYRRPKGERIKFEDNSLVVLKDNKGNPKGTLLKGPVAKEAADRWPNIAKIANNIV